MKLKFLSLVCALGLFAFGTNAMAQDEKAEAPAEHAEAKKDHGGAEAKTQGAPAMMKLVGPLVPLVHPNAFCNPSTNNPPTNPYCTKTLSDGKDNPQYSSIKCDAICTGYKKAHEFITGQLCFDPAVTPKAPSKPYPSCAKLCAPTGATLNDLSCCLTQVGDSLSVTTKS